MKTLLLAAIAAFFTSASFADATMVPPGAEVPNGACAEGCVILDKEALLELQRKVEEAIDAAFAEGAKQKGLTCLRNS